MEVVVAEEKKKIFRARKTMKMSDRLQLESLHSTLLTSASSLSSPSPPPLMNGTHKDDGQKAADKEQNNISGSNSPNATSPVSQTPVSSPVPFLSLNLSPSPPGSQSPKDQEVTSPRTPAQSAFFDCNKAENEDSSPALLDESSSSTQPKKDTTGAPLDEEEQEKKSTTEHQSVDTSPNDSASSSHAAPVESEFTRPIEGENDSSTKTNPDPFVSKVKDGKPYSPKASSSSTSLSKSHSDAEKKKSVDVKEESIKDEKTKKILIKRGFKCDEKMEVDLVKEEVKKEKREVGQTTKSSRPSSTPPSHTGQEKSSSSTLKRTLSEGSEIDVPTVKREGKRPKVEHEELEAQLELKISAKAGNHHKLEKIVQQLVEERLKIMELTVFDKNFQELKARVDKIDCANKHQTALSSLQTKISRLAKKFGEANQASENKRKQEALAAAAAAVAAPVAAPVATTTTTAATAPKTTTVTTVPQPQRVLRRQTVEPQPEVPREGMAPSLGKTPALSVKVEMEEEDMGYEQETDVSRQIAMATKLAEYSEGRCRADVKLRPISSHLESVLYNNCKRSSGNPRPDRYASYLFRYLVPYDVYCDWVAKVNYVGLMGKEALPTNLRRAMRMYIDHRFPLLSTESWREIRDVINEILRVKRRPEFFREYDGRTSMLY